MRPASEQYPFAVIASILVVSLLCLGGSFQTFDLESADRQQLGDPFMVTQFLRPELVLSAVPENAELGYVSDVQSRTLGPALILSAQFVLAPRLLGTLVFVLMEPPGLGLLRLAAEVRQHDLQA